MLLRKFAKKKIGEILIEEGALDPQNLEKALEIQKREGGLIAGILARTGWISEEELVAALSKQLSIPFIRLSHYNVNRNALKFIPRELAERHLFFPFEEGDHSVSLAMSDPLNEGALESIEKRIPFRIQVFLSTVSEIKEAIGSYYGEPAPEVKGAQR